MLTETDHPYYCSESNYFSNEAQQTYDSVTDFLDEFEEADEDMNLVFRFDITRRSADTCDNDDLEEQTKEHGPFFVNIFMILQRKGIYKPISCESYNPETEGERLYKYLARHFARNMENWAPFSAGPVC